MLVMLMAAVIMSIVGLPAVLAIRVAFAALAWLQGCSIPIIF